MKKNGFNFPFIKFTEGETVIMLYIFFGKDKIGKKTVRDRIAKSFGMTIIPKFTRDTTNKWKIRYQKTSNKWDDLPGEIRFDSSEKDEVSRTIKEAYAQYPKLQNTRKYLHRADDMYLKFLQGEPKMEDFLYDIKKNVDGKEKVVQYLIRRDHIARALEDVSANYILVCASGGVIDQIMALHDELIKEKGSTAVAGVQLVFIDGQPRESRQQSSWNTSPADYFLKYSYKFLKITNYTCLQTGTEIFDEVSFNRMIDKQWMNKARMMPVCISCFVVRPFSDTEHEFEFNVNDLCFDELTERIVSLQEDVRKSGMQARDIIFESLDSNGNTIFKQISGVISESQLVLVDLRGHRQNCYYEYGYAQALAEMLGGKCKSVIGLLGTVVDGRKGGVFNNKLLCQQMDNNVKNIWTNIRAEERQKAFDVTQFAHYKYVGTILNGYDRVKVELDILPPDGSEPTFDEKIENILKFKFNGINAFTDE